MVHAHEWRPAIHSSLAHAIPGNSFCAKKHEKPTHETHLWNMVPKTLQYHVASKAWNMQLQYAHEQRIILGTKHNWRGVPTLFSSPVTFFGVWPRSPCRTCCQQLNALYAMPTSFSGCSYLVLHPNCDVFIPVWIKWKGWCGRFYSDQPGDVGPSFENASIESKTPRHFQVDNLYRIAVAEIVYKHHSL